MSVLKKVLYSLTAFAVALVVFFGGFWTAKLTADKDLKEGLCSIGKTKTKSGRAETDKSKLNRKRVIELPEKSGGKMF